MASSSTVCDIVCVATSFFNFQPTAGSSHTVAATATSTRASSILDSALQTATRTATRAALSQVATLAAAANSPSLVPVMKQSKPFAPRGAVLGGIPTPSLDVPISAIFLVLFILGGISHLATEKINSKRGHKFKLQSFMFDFCLARTLTMTFRIIWAFKPNDNNIVLTALILENAGAIVLFAINTVLAQRILRALHPNLGWAKPPSTFILITLITIPVIIASNIAWTVVGSYVTKKTILDTSRGFLLFGASYSLYLSILPLVIIIPAGLIPGSRPIEKFGRGLFRNKVAILALSSLMLFAGAFVRLFSAVDLRPKENPGRLNGKAVFYTTGFMLEIFVVYGYLITRFDLRFWVPDGCTQPGDYQGKAKTDTDEETLFEEVDVKMRMSVREPADFDAAAWIRDQAQRGNSTRQQVRQAIYDLGFKTEVVGPPIDAGETEVLLYAFRVKKGPGSPSSPPSAGYPQRPPRHSAEWLEVADRKDPVSMI